ncbi:xylan 1,4-beta-xylosidase [Actinomadura barringtoniae]|uniref:Xylan 1,4-beta-xylosidase n=1 Tax=Actinomadura barringtoniae TaxID=1427535 RepID=A0A939PAK3_9ACTN|nr:xylan 1,4-beta-xylosidase [Actinomadura barringtoniae]MBO2449096.1 xylan 1,4-beta-xylosidase [Actinomadura barringtoniae]
MAIAVAIGLVLIAVPAVVTFAGSDSSSSPTTGTKGAGAAVGGGGSGPAWGFTHTQNTVPDSSGAAAQRAAVAAQPVAQNQAIMGWGADNPEPAPGRYDFGTLDKRVQLIRQTKGVPVITLCCAPDWMKGGGTGTTDWAKIETAPTAAHYDDFAALSAQVARRYPDVRYFMVWNEFKGFFDQGRWDYTAYTTLYNKVYTAVKKANPRAQVGGPYVPMSSNAVGQGPTSQVSGTWGSVDPRALSSVEYWLKNKVGADFLVVDGSSLPDQTGVKLNEFSALAKFGAVTQWLRTQSKLPIWWAEWYVQPEGVTWTDQRLGAVQAAALIQFIRSGASAAFYWSPQSTTQADCVGCLWSGTAAGNNGTPTLTMLQNFTRWFPPGTPLVQATSSDPAVLTLAQKQQLLAVNTSAEPARSTINGTPLDLGPYEIRWVSW